MTGGGDGDDAEARYSIDDLLDEAFWTKAVREVLRGLDAVDPLLKARLRKAIVDEKLHFPGFTNRSILAAPPAVLAGPLAKVLSEHQAVLDAIIAAWLAMRGPLLDDARAFLATLPPTTEGESGADSFSDPVALADAFVALRPEVDRAEAALLFSQLVESDGGVGDEGDDDGLGDAALGVPPMTSGDDGSGESDRASKALAKERERSAKLREEARALSAKAAEAGKDAEAARKALREAEKREKDLKAEEDRRVDERVADFAKRAFLLFYASSEEEALDAAVDAFDDAIAKAREASAKQAKWNERYGTIAWVRNRHARATEALADLKKAREESVFPLQEVDVALRRLETLISATEKVPEVARVLGTSAPPLAAVDIAEVEALGDAKGAMPRLERISALLPALKESGLLSAGGFVALSEAVRKATAKILVRIGLLADTAPAGGGSRNDFDAEMIKGRLKGKEFLVDGNNVLLTTLQADGSVVVDGFTAKRNAFNTALSRATRDFARVTVVYDGNEDSVREYGGVTVVFTDASGRDFLADDWIARHVADSPAGSVVIATNDQGLIARCSPKIHRWLGARDAYDYATRPR